MRWKIKLVSFIILVLFYCKVKSQSLNQKVIDSNISFTINCFNNKNEIIRYYIGNGYKLYYANANKIKNTNFIFFIFLKIEPTFLFPEHGKKLLVVCKIEDDELYSIIANVDNLIHKSSIFVCNNDDDLFEKIVSKGQYFTIEQSKCAKFKKKIFHEYITFKYDTMKDEFFLYKYSVVLESLPIKEHGFSGEESEIETITENDFGKIKLQDFSYKTLEKYYNKFPTYITESFQEERE